MTPALVFALGLLIAHNTSGVAVPSSLRSPTTAPSEESDGPLSVVEPLEEMVSPEQRHTVNDYNSLLNQVSR